MNPLHVVRRYAAARRLAHAHACREHVLARLGQVYPEPLAAPALYLDPAYTLDEMDAAIAHLSESGLIMPASRDGYPTTMLALWETHWRLTSRGSLYALGMGYLPRRAPGRPARRGDTRIIPAVIAGRAARGRSARHRRPRTRPVRARIAPALAAVRTGVDTMLFFLLAFVVTYVGWSMLPPSPGQVPEPIAHAVMLGSPLLR